MNLQPFCWLIQF